MAIMIGENPVVTRSDISLVEAVLSGDRSAFGELYDRYVRLVRAVCCDTTRDLTRAQDLSQEVFLRAYGKLGQLRDPDKFAAWLVGIARTMCQEWQRRQKRDRHQFVGAGSDVPDCDCTGPVDDKFDSLRQAMQSLPERERLALHAFYLQGESADAVRKALDLSRSGVYRLLDRARQRLAKLLRGDKP